MMRLENNKLNLIGEIGGEDMHLEKESKKGNLKEHKRNILKGIGMMGACCLLPAIIMAILPIISSSLGVGGTRIAYTLSSLICPIMMIGMILMMAKGTSCCSKDKEDKEDKSDK